MMEVLINNFPVCISKQHFFYFGGLSSAPRRQCRWLAPLGSTNLRVGFSKIEIHWFLDTTFVYIFWQFNRTKYDRYYIEHR